MYFKKENHDCSQCWEVLIKGIFVYAVYIIPYFTFINLDWNHKPSPQESKSHTTPSDISETDLLELNIFLNVCWMQNFYDVCTGIV